MHDCWQGQFSVESFTLLIWKTRHDRGGEMSRVDTSSARNAKLCHKTTHQANVWTAVRYFWLVLINRSRLSCAFRCWELITSMNIWWIIRSLILLAVVVILFSSHSVALLFLESFNLKANEQIHSYVIQVVLKWWVVTQKKVMGPFWMGHGQLVKKGNKI